MDLLVVIPCLNESETLGKCIKKAKNQIKKLDFDNSIVSLDLG